MMSFMKTVKQTYHIKAPVEMVWDALVDPKHIDKWGGGPAKMDGKVGTKFSLWGGSIWGKNTKVISGKKLVQDWYSDSEEKKWKEPSVVMFDLSKEEDGSAHSAGSGQAGSSQAGTKLELIHENIPDEDAKNIDEGWKDYYLGPLKEYVEKL